MAKQVGFNSSTSTVKCECGKVVDTDKAMLDNEGSWLCPECYNDMLEEYKTEQKNNFKSENNE